MNETILKTKNIIRVVTATALFDGHDASINIIRRMFQDSGVEVIHLGHNRSVSEIIDAAISEDVQGICVSSYQGGHLEFFKYIIDLLKENCCEHIKVFGGGGGVIVPDEITELEAYGVSKIFSPEDGSNLGLQGMINHMLSIMDFSVIREDVYQTDISAVDIKNKSLSDKYRLTNIISAFESGINENGEKQYAPELETLQQKMSEQAERSSSPVIGITGTGGAGKSSLTDEIIFRFLHDFKEITIAVISCDPSRRRTKGALLGDRIRMNSLKSDRVFMRSLATRKPNTPVPEVLDDVVNTVRAAGFDIIIVETAGIGQGNSSIIDIVDLPVYVMTSEFGAASQLEKIDMLDFAEFVVVNKFEKQGGEDALRDVCKQLQRNLKKFDKNISDMPVFGTIASKFNDDGVTQFYFALLDKLNSRTGINRVSSYKLSTETNPSPPAVVIPPERINYLSEIVETIRHYHKKTDEQADAIREKWHIDETINAFSKKASLNGNKHIINELEAEADTINKAVTNETLETLKHWEAIKKRYAKDELVFNVRGKQIAEPLYSESLSKTKIPRIVLPKFKDPGEIYRWLREENLPGFFPFSAGLFPLKRTSEDPTRMFAGEGDPARTNRRFKLLSESYEAKRLSTAFDAVTLFGYDPDRQPDIYGKIGTSGVNVCTLEDVKVLYSGFSLCSPNTSVSMTINGPSPIILAMFLNTAIDQEIQLFKKHNANRISQKEEQTIRRQVLENIRGTVQADILKEDQGQNSCIFSIDFALKMMGDIQEYFIQNSVKNFYSVSISGYHIAEAGANPITQLALTLANGFTYIEYYLARGMAIDDFAPNLSFFFSNGMDPEYTVLGKVARRIWAIAMREKYNAGERSQKLKYHIQTSGRSLHSQDIQFNDIRTTLQGLCAIYDNCNSLHTNSYDEAITTPSDESVRRALAIQMIVNKEWGLSKNENMNQGSFIVEELTALVEEAVLIEFERISRRGGVLGAMETGYQRSKIQEESIYYETLKHSGEFPIIGVNTFCDPDTSLASVAGSVTLARATEDEKNSQLQRLESFKNKNKSKAKQALDSLQAVALSGENIFGELMETVKYCSLGQITKALGEVGGKYRRSM